MADKTTKQEIQEVNTRLLNIETAIGELNNIEITVKNGTEKHVIYRRNEFFQMLHDRKNVWKEKVRITAKDIILFLGVITLIVDRLIEIF